jgi:hypothetical protein
MANTTAVRTAQVGAAPFFAGKNKIINGDFGVWQRGTSIATTNAYTADRWLEVNNTNSITYTRSTDVPSSLGFQYSISRAGTGSNMTQRIEAANAAQLAGQTVTLSFYYKSTAGADNFSTLFYYANSADNFGAVTQIGSTQTIATPATSWTRVSYTFASISANAANGLAIYFARGSGATSTTLITGIQLEVGSTATAFQTATGTIQGELAACQRYYIRYVPQTTGSAGAIFGVSPTMTTTTIADTIFPMPVTMRTNVASMETNQLGIYRSANATRYESGTFTLTTATEKIAVVRYTHGSAVFTAGETGLFVTGTTATNPYVGLSAEL